MATKKRAKKKSSLKIKSKREKARAKRKRKTRRKRVKVKTVKLSRSLKKARALAKKALKSAVKGISVSKVPEKIYKKIDAALAKNADFQNAVTAAVIEAANEFGAVKKTRKRKKKAPAEASGDDASE